MEQSFSGSLYEVIYAAAGESGLPVGFSLDAACVQSVTPGKKPDAVGAASATPGQGPDAEGATPGQGPDAACARSATPGQGPDSAGAEPSQMSVSFADGALDGMTMYHMGSVKMEEKDRKVMEDAVSAAARGDHALAEQLFGILGKNIRALSVIRELQIFCMAHTDELNGDQVYRFASELLRTSSDKESVKLALSLLSLFDMTGDEETMEAVRTLGLSDEFTLFCLGVMRYWENAADEIWELAKKVHGWGRIHAVDFLEPVTEEIREWFLTDAVHNEVMPAYSAFTCWQKGQAEQTLEGELSPEEYCGIRDIFFGLLDEGPVAGLSAVEDEEKNVIRFLDHVSRRKWDERDIELIRAIRDRYAESTEASEKEVSGDGVPESGAPENGVSEREKSGSRATGIVVVCETLLATANTPT